MGDYQKQYGEQNRAGPEGMSSPLAVEQQPEQMVVTQDMASGVYGVTANSPVPMMKQEVVDGSFPSTMAAAGNNSGVLLSSPSAVSPPKTYLSSCVVPSSSLPYVHAAGGNYTMVPPNTQSPMYYPMPMQYPQQQYVPGYGSNTSFPNVQIPQFVAPKYNSYNLPGGHPVTYLPPGIKKSDGKKKKSSPACC